MKIKILQTPNADLKRVRAGDVVEVSDRAARQLIQGGMAEPVVDAKAEAAPAQEAPAPEAAPAQEQPQSEVAPSSETKKKGKGK